MYFCNNQLFKNMSTEELKLESLRIYQKKTWLDEYNKPLYSKIREKILDEFRDLVFIEEGHRYFVGERELTSVSVMIHNFKEEFDVITEAQRTYERQYDNVQSKYYRMLPEQIRDMWKSISDTACSVGTERHEFAESLFHFLTGNEDKILPQFKDRVMTDEEGRPYMLAIEAKEIAAGKVFQDIPECVVPILSETKVFNIEEEYAYSGTFDILFYYNAELLGKGNENSGLYVWDWKTNKDLFKNFAKKTLLPPFDEMLDMPKSIYTLQLNAYQMALEKIGLKVVRRQLFWLRPNGEYQKISLENITSKLDKALRELKR